MSSSSIIKWWLPPSKCPFNPMATKNCTKSMRRQPIKSSPILNQSLATPTQKRGCIATSKGCNLIPHCLTSLLQLMDRSFKGQSPSSKRRNRSSSLSSSLSHLNFPSFENSSHKTQNPTRLSMFYVMSTSKRLTRK